MKYLFIVLLIWLFKEPVLVKLWKSYPVPTKEQAKGYNLDSSDWQVFIKDNLVLATSDRYFKPESLPFGLPKGCSSDFGGRQTIVSFPDGYLVGFDKGEWGGALGWFDKKGKECLKISDDQVVKIVRVDDQVFAIEGLAHLSTSRGSLLRIYKKGGKWQVEKYLGLPYAPEGLGVDSNKNLIVITSNNLIKVRKDKSIEVLIKDGFWSYGLYPNSLIIKDDVAFIGMRKGVLKYNLNTKAQEWLMDE
ncbi:hypothetical protein GU926_08675 [Nibribacter ruber]|uniref:Uncharacterized protein n=1 Tax=Nibribacter ruber TaxID=2698458 RepID=A0A6P1NUV1_9BACT|nr:hypothetical protein [Nibribacter ruber]QHL87507.1 hypothetical protein GU926_08675 [Nibribacter ruber]